MQYLLQNKVNYLNNSQSIVYVNTITNQSEDFIIYTNNDIHSFEFHWFNPNEQTGTTFDIVNAVYTYICNNIIYSIRPAFTCSNFIDITSNDSVTIRLDLINSDEVVFTKEYTCLLKKQPLNTLNCIDVINHINKEITTVKITATSTIPLTLYNISPILKEGITYKLIGEVDIL